MTALAGGSRGRRKRLPAESFAWFSALFLFLQGTSTLAARLVPAIDRAIPWLLEATAMRPTHSWLHIGTALLAAFALAAGPRAAWIFAGLFGAFYLMLGLTGYLGPEEVCGLSRRLELQPFDHPFHILLGSLGLVAAWRSRGRLAARDAAASATDTPGASS